MNKRKEKAKIKANKVSQEQPKPEKPNQVAKKAISCLDYVLNRVYAMFTMFVTHYKPHADEIVCMLLLITEAGRQVFPRVFPAGEVDFTRCDFRRNNPRTGEYKDHLESMYVGLAASDYDDHAVRNNPGENAACTLVARTIGLDKCPWWIKTLVDVAVSDRKGGDQPGSIPHLTKMLYRAFGNNEEGIQQTIYFGLMAYTVETEFLKLQWAKFSEIYKSEKKLWDAWYEYLSSLGGPITSKKAREYLAELKYGQEKIDWFIGMVKAANDYEVNSKIEARQILEWGSTSYYPVTIKGREAYVCAVETDNLEIDKICWSKKDIFHRKVAVLIVKSSTGHTSLRANRDFGLDMGIIHEKLQNSETRGAEWVLPDHRGAVFNGNSERFSEVLPTQHSIGNNSRLVQRFLDDQGRERSRKSFSELKFR